MPGEEGFISALTAPVVNLALAAVVIALIVVVLMALLYVVTSRQSSNNLRAALDNSNKLLGALVSQGNQQATQGNQISRHGELLENMVHVLERGQGQLTEHGATIAATKTAIETHDEKSAGYVERIEAKADARQLALATQIKETTAQTMTDLIGATTGIVDKSTEKIVNALLQGFGTIRTNIETVQREYRQKMEAIGDQVADMQQQFIQAVRIDAGGAHGQQTVVDLVGGDSGDGLSSGDSSGSAGGDSGGNRGAADGGNNGAIA